MKSCLWMICRDLTHWGWVTHIFISELTIIGSDNGLLPGRHQAIIWNNAGLLLIEPLGTNVNEISIGIQIFTFKKMHLNMSSVKWHPFCLGLNVSTKWDGSSWITSEMALRVTWLNATGIIWNCTVEVNSLWPSDAIWRQRSGSTLAQVMACCLTAPSHCLNQCWLIISKVLWHSSEGNFIRDTSATIHSS